jgi:hypothetical protein
LHFQKFQTRKIPIPRHKRPNRTAIVLDRRKRMAELTKERHIIHIHSRR